MIRNRNKKRKKSEKSKEKKGKKKKTQIEMAAIEGQSSRVKNHMLCSSSSPLAEIDSGGTAFLDNDDTLVRYQSFFGNEEEILHSDFRLVEEFSKMSVPPCEYCKLFILFKIYFIQFYLFRGRASSRNLN
jgi:hypothetical protein